MTDLIGWITDVMDISFTVGTATVTLGLLAVGAVILSLGLGTVRRIMGRR